MIVNVLVETTVNKHNQMFTYLVPNIIKDKIKIGIRVLVPFGKRQLEGFILEILTEEKKYDYELKSVIDVIDEEPVLNNEMIELGRYMSDHYLAPLISCYQTMLPVGLKAKTRVKVNPKTENYIIIAKSVKEINDFINSNPYQKQNEILIKLLNNKKIKKTNINGSPLLNLIKQGLVKEVAKEYYRLDENFSKKESNIELTKNQQNAINEIINNKQDSIFLIHGVTGSGKTEIYMNIIKEALNENKTALILVPEISLTTQLINQFKNRFGKKIAVLHSALSDGEKYDEWRKIVRKEVSIVIGARSAIFAPIINIGIIVIDEEQEGTYKQENNPRYHTLDIAIFRAKKHNAKIILGSATPSLETYARARKGIYKLLELKERINQKPMPEVTIIDMKESIKKGNTLFSDILIAKIKEKLNNQEQIMILLNRRGYANYVICRDCGYVHKCQNCDITLTYHKTNETMRCHYCGYADKKKLECSKCSKGEMKIFGIGTQKVEEKLKELFDDIKIVRMDSDTTNKKGSHDKIINDFNHHKYDLLLGTQMIAKGLDFSKVTLVGVINGDMSLSIPDFRSGENTFQLLSQVAGRSGRSNEEGEVIIQTFNPDHYVIQTAKNHDYIGFYKREMIIRKKLNYPPYCFIALIRVLAKDYNEGLKESSKISSYLRKKLSNNQILGPSVSSLSKIKNTYRFQCLIKYRTKKELDQELKKVISHYENNSKVSIEIDFNPLKL